MNKWIWLLLCCFSCVTVGARQPQGAHLKLEDPTHNFGDAPRKGGDLVHDFAFVNDGTAPLVIIRVITSCSCLKGSYSKKPIAPGERGYITITYEPHKSEPGAFNKVVRIYSNSSTQYDVITVQGNSIDGERKTHIRNVKIRGEKVKVKADF